MMKRPSFFNGIDNESAICLILILALGGLRTLTFAADGPPEKATINPTVSVSRAGTQLLLKQAMSPWLLAKLQEPPAATTTNSQGASTPAHREPFPFSHKRHVAMHLDCSFCHEDSQTGTRAGFPVAQRCMTCHAQMPKDADPLKKLAALTADTQIVPEKPLYKLPDYVFFSHSRHKAANVECATCHGDVWQTDVVELKLPMRMKGCIDCHRTSNAPIKCDSCHEPFQQ